MALTGKKHLGYTIFSKEYNPENLNNFNRILEEVNQIIQQHKIP